MRIKPRSIVGSSGGASFFRAVARNPVVRGTLLARGLTDEELALGWQLYSDLHGFGKQAQALPATKQTAAAQAINALDAWDAPAYGAAHAVLDVRFPEVSAFLFKNLEATIGLATVAGVQRFLDRLALLRDGKAPNVDPEKGRAAIEPLATRKIVDAAKEAELRQLIDTARLGARPDEVIIPAEMDPRRRDVAEPYINWLNEWREVARVSIAPAPTPMQARSSHSCATTLSAPRGHEPPLACCVIYPSSSELHDERFINTVRD